MSKRKGIIRYRLIISRLRKSPATFQEIYDFLENESSIQGDDFVVSKRQFQRDINDIASIYGVEIKFDHRIGKYCLDTETGNVVHDRFLESLDVMRAFSINENLTDFVQFENRNPAGTEHLYGILHAILNLRKITFTHQKYWDDSPTCRTIEPYGLKEFRNRWYVVGKDLGDNRIKSFGLDRIDNLGILRETFTKPVNFVLKRHFQHCFGVIGLENNPPEEVLLSFHPVQGRYVKSMPLHQSQTIVKDDSDEVIIKLKVHITFDFIQELLSFGSWVKVLQPQGLVNEIKASIEEALALYSDKD